MGNPQHLEWLLEGVDAWNARRKANFFIPDLAEFDIAEAFKAADKLNEANRIPLAGAHLSYADLRGSVLLRADLRGASLYRAVLWRAELKGADTLSRIYKGTGADARRAIEFTDLSATLGLMQDQLDSMDGDTGTILPLDLIRPSHWPDLPELPPEEPAPAPQDTLDQPADRQVAALKAQVQIILSAPAENATMAHTFAAQLNYATQTFRRANNDVPDDLLLVEQIADRFKELARVIPEGDEDKLGKELSDALALIDALRAEIDAQNEELKALKAKPQERSDWQKGRSAFAISFGTALGAGTAAAILSGGQFMLGEFGASALNGLRNAFDGLFQPVPAQTPPLPSLGP